MEHALIQGAVHDDEVGNGSRHITVGTLHRHLSGQVICICAHVAVAEVCMIDSWQQDYGLMPSSMPAAAIVDLKI